MSSSSDIRRITTYGKQRVKYTSSRRDWVALMSSGASQISSVSSTHPNVASDIRKSRVTPTIEDHVNNNVEAGFQAPRKRVNSIKSSNASSSSTPVLSKPKMSVKPAREVVNSNESGGEDEYSDLASSHGSYVRAARRKPVTKSGPNAYPDKRMSILVSKDSNLINTTSPLAHHGKAVQTESLATVESSDLNDTFARSMLSISPWPASEKGRPTMSPQSHRSMVQGKDTIAPVSANFERSGGSLPYLPSQTRGPVMSTGQRVKYTTPAYDARSVSILARLPSTGFLSPRPPKAAPLSRSRISSSSFHDSALTHASSTSSRQSCGVVANAKVHVAPPRGHGVTADVLWRQPLTPLNTVGLLSTAPAAPRSQSSPWLLPVVPSDHDVRNLRTDLHTAHNVAGISGSSCASAKIEPADALVGPKVLPNREVEDLGTHLHNLVLGQKITSCSSDNGDTRKLDSLLSLCGSGGRHARVYEFAEMVEAFPLVQGTEIQPLVWSKISEATYSEVFMCSRTDQTRAGVVVKIIPLQESPMPVAECQSRCSHGSISYSDDYAIPFSSNVEDVERELRITMSLQGTNGESESGRFAKLLGTYIVHGRYPTPLLSAWDAFRAAKPNAAENPSPAAFGDNQNYALICLEHAGEDLETVKLKSFVDAASLLWQIASALASAEAQHKFEHRDLHWGNILVQATQHSFAEDPQPACLAEASTTLRCTIIDFTLSRVDTPEAETVYGSFDDDGLFAGKGDFQYECYRHMRTLTGDNWRSYTPMTNVLWLQYLVGKLLRSKRIRKPTTRVKAATIILASGPCTPRKTRGGRSAAVAVRPVLKQALCSSSKDQLCVSPNVNAYNALCKAEVVLAAAVEQALDRANSGCGSAHVATDSPPNAHVDSASSFVAWWLAL